MIRHLVGDCRVTLPTLEPGSVQACVTSPPYYSLRDYGTPPLVWGGDEDHAHVWAAAERFSESSIRESRAGLGSQERTRWLASGLCACGAWLGSLGLEPTPGAYIDHLVECFRHVRRVLRDDGVLWLNLGDSYAGSGKGPSNSVQGPASQLGRAPTQWLSAPGGLKNKDLMMIPFRVAMALQADGWWLRSVIPWVKRNCLSGGTRVYVRCQKGDMPMTVKDLARLDPKTCQLWNGERWTQVLSVWEAAHDEGDPIEIELRSGERIGCTPEHRWPTDRGLLPTFALRVGDVLKGSWLPTPDARRPAALDDEDVGWFVGLYVAEGSRSKGTIQIASHAKETERFERLCRIAAAFDGTCRAHLKGANGMTINLTGPVLNAIIDQYVGGRLADDKHLTNRCWMRSNEFLRAVLGGYLHGDGHYDAKNRRWRLGFTRNYAWEGDLRTIAARLNLDLRLKLATIPYDGRDVGIFRGSLRFERTTKLWTKNEREVMRIGRSRGRKFWDIAVEDDPHTFALASGVLTHNCMPEAVTDRPSTSLEYVFLLSKSGAPTFWTHRDGRTVWTQPPPDYRWIRRDSGEETSVDPGDEEDWRRLNLWRGHDYFWNADAVRVAAKDWGSRDRSQSRDKVEAFRANGQPPHSGLTNGDFAATGRNRRNGDWFFESWQGLMLDEQDDPLALVVNPRPFSGAHFATFAPRLVEPMVKASTRPGDTILDPFSGAGTVGLVANRLGRDAVLAELKPEYAEMSAGRIDGDAPMFTELSA